MLSKKLAAVDRTRCVACGVCENTCPLGAVKVRRGCYAAVEAERCVGCGKCAKLCPVGCIEVPCRFRRVNAALRPTCVAGSSGAAQNGTGRNALQLEALSLNEIGRASCRERV